MKQIKKLLICTFTAFMLVSCTSNDNKESELSFFDPRENFPSGAESVNFARENYDYNNITDDYDFTTYDISDKVKQLDSAVVSDKYIFIADNPAGAIHVYDKKFNFVKYIVTYDDDRGNICPVAMCIDKNDNLYAVNPLTGSIATIIVFDNEGEYLRHLTVELKDSLPIGEKKQASLKNIVVLDNDDIYLSLDRAYSAEVGKIIQVDQEGKVLSVVGNNSFGVLSKTSVENEVAFTNSMYKSRPGEMGDMVANGQPALYRFHGTAITQMEKIAPHIIVKLKVPEESKSTEEDLRQTSTDAMTFYDNEYYLLSHTYPGIFMVFDTDFKYVRTQKINHEKGWETYLTSDGMEATQLQRMLRFKSIDISGEKVYISATSGIGGKNNTYIIVGEKRDK